MSKYIPILIFLIYFGINLWILPHYGVNWDEPNHFGRGQAIVHFFLTGEKDYKSLNKNVSNRRSFYQSDAYTFTFFEKKFTEAKPLTIGGHPPLSGILAALSNTLFYEKLGIFGDIEAYHFYSVFLAAVFIGIIFYFVRDIYGSFAALIATISLITYPLFLGESRFNIKDVPQAVYFGLTIICFYYTMVKNSVRWLIVTALFFGLGLATKLNILFALPIVFLWAISVKKRKMLLRSFLVIPLIGAAIFLVSWPMVWADPVNRIVKVLAYYKGIGTNTGFDPRYLTFFRLNTYAGQWILYTTPLVTLFLSFLGFVSVLKRQSHKKHRASLLVLFWFVIPIARVTLPNTNIYGGVRQIMEYIPAMAILAGIGAGAIIRRFKRHRLLLQAVIILSFLPITMKMIAMHPNESVYFNPLIGGLKGAAARNIPGWGNSLGSTYRQGVRWINAHAEEGAKLATGFGLRSNIALIDLRGDIQFENRFRSGPRHDGEYIIEVTHDGTAEDLYLRKYLDRFLTPVYELDVEGVPVLKIWKNDLEHTKEPYRERTVARVEAVVKHANGIDIDIGSIVQITRLIVSYGTDASCSLPANGLVEYSPDGNDWLRAANDFTSSPVSSYFNPQPQPGVVQFLFAADTARYIRLIILDKNSCLVTGPIAVSVRHL